MPPRRAIFIANPAARRLARRDAFEAAIIAAGARFDLNADIVWTQAPGEGVAVARDAASAGADLLFACGGDGTLNEVLNGLSDLPAQEAPLVGQVPAGTANVWAREASIPRRDFAAAIAAQLDAPGLPVDLGRIGERRFLLMTSFGFDARAVSAVNAGFKQRAGTLAYMLAGFKAGWRYPGFHIDLILDDDPPLRLHASMLVVGNTRNYGGVADITARASAVDGQLDIVAFLGHGVWPALRLLPGVLLRRSHLDSPHVLFRRARRVRLQSLPGERLPDLQLDGEIGVPPDTAATDLRVEPAAVRMLVPRPHAPLFRPPRD